MHISGLEVKNWKNFTHFNVDFGETVFVIGPNASGKSNFLDLFRFMRDIVNPNGGGLQYALDVRHGLSKVRSLAARRHPQVELSFTLAEERPEAAGSEWRYTLAIATETRGKHRPVVVKEEVQKNGETLLSRPNKGDAGDAEQLTVTYLEQVHLNREFRCIADFFQDILYLHLVPQLLKYSSDLAVKKIESDPFGQGFLEEIANTPAKMQTARLNHIESILQTVVPHFKELRFKRDSGGRPHLEMRHAHWRPNAGWQMEDQFSDGTLRLIAILWILLSNRSMILLEEPELSLHAEIVGQIPSLIQKARRYVKKSGGQLVVSTHSEVLLSDKSIDANFLIMKPGLAGEATIIETPSEEDLLAIANGLSAADVLFPRTAASIGHIDL